MRHLKTFLTVIGAVTILVLAANTAVYAATGGKFILGKTNKANKVSTLKRTTSGPALSLKTTSNSAAPMTVNGSGKVANLNADKVDGYDSSSMVNSTRVYTIPNKTNVTSFTVTFPGLPGGIYQANYNYVADTQAGTSGVNCEFELNSVGTLLTYGALASHFSAVSGGGILDTRGKTVDLRCFTFSTQFSSTTPAGQVSFTSLSSSTSGAGARVAGSSARTGGAAG
jgi:hypothetical protein